MRGINHPSIVKLHHFFESEEHYFLILECEYPFDMLYVYIINMYISNGRGRTLPPNCEAHVFQWEPRTTCYPSSSARNKIPSRRTRCSPSVCTWPYIYIRDEADLEIVTLNLKIFYSRGFLSFLQRIRSIVLTMKRRKTRENLYRGVEGVVLVGSK